MTTTKHTPGPWLTIYESEEQETDNVITSLRVAIPHHKKGMNWTERFDTHAANEQLASAAPDLLAALEALLHEADMTTDGEDNPRSVPTFVNWKTGLRAAADQARAAIAKAKP